MSLTSLMLPSKIEYINQDKLQEEKGAKEIRIYVLSRSFGDPPFLLDEFVTVYDQLQDIPVVITNFILKYSLDQYGSPKDILYTGSPFVSDRGHENYNLYCNTETERYLFKVYFKGIENAEPIKDQLLKIVKR